MGGWQEYVLSQERREGGRRQQAQRFPALLCHVTCPRPACDITAQADKTQVSLPDWGPLVALLDRWGPTARCDLPSQR